MGTVPGRRAAGPAGAARLMLVVALLLGTGFAGGDHSREPSAHREIPELHGGLPADVVEAYVEPHARRLVLTPAPGTGSALRTRFADDPSVVVASERDAPRRSSSAPSGGAGWAGSAVGGAPLTGGGRACTLGFTGTRGGVPVFLTAGHCGATGTAFVSGGRAVGVIERRAFPERDYAVGVLTAGYGSGLVGSSDGKDVPIRGSLPAPVGERVCTLGATSGWSCGTVLAHDVTVKYGAGEQAHYVRGLTKVGLCTAGGDSGGPWLWGAQAQGLTSGGAQGAASAGAAGCGTGDGDDPGEAVAYVQPLAPILAETGVVLDTTTHTGPHS